MSVQEPSSTRWWTLAIVTLATSMLMLDLSVVNVALPSVRADLAVESLSDLQWVLDAYALTLGVFLLTGGSLGDRFGRKRIFLAGFGLFSVASLMCGAAWDTLSLNLARGVQGVGAAVLFAVGPALIAQEFRGKERATALGVFAGGYGVAIAAAPLVGGALTQGVSWRWVFLINVPLGIFAIVAGAWKIRDTGERRNHGDDWLGLISFSLSMTALVYAILRGNAEGWTSGLILGLFAVATVLMAVFIAIERARGERAMLDLSLFRNRSFNGLAAVSVILMGTALAAIFLETAFIQNELNHSPLETGVRMLPLTAVLMVTGGVVGGLTARVSPRYLLGFGSVAAAVGLVTVPLMVADDSSWTALLLSFLLLGIGLGIFNPTRAAMAINIVEPRKAGMSNGASETFQQIGVALGIAIFGALYEARLTSHFADSGVGRELGATAERLGEPLAAGGSQVAADAVPADVAVRAVEAAHSAAVSGLTETFAIGAGVMVLSAVIGFAFVSGKDMHESSLAEAEGPATPPADEAAVMLPATSPGR
jgi:EmrB/QacA subfamily drug resistance transporter